MAAAMLMMSGPSEAKMPGKSVSSTESSQSGYDMTGKPILLPQKHLVGLFASSAMLEDIKPVNSGTKHRGLKPGQRKEIMAAAKDSAQKAQQGVKK